MRWKFYHYCILFLAIIFIAILVYSPHFNYKYPFKYDEWFNIAKGVHYLDKGFQEDLNFTNYPKNHLRAIDYEIGSPLVLSFFFLFIDPILQTKYLPSLFAIITALILFFFLYKRYNFLTGIFAIFLFASLKSNVNISGPWFLVPQTMVFPLFFLFLFLFENKTFFWSILIYFIILLMHPLTALILFPAILIYSLINFKKYKFPIIIIIFIFTLLFLIYTKILWKGSISSTIFYFINILSFKTYPKNMIKFFIPTFYGILPFLFAIVALIPLIKKRRFLLPISITTTLILVSIYNNFNIQILSSYARTFYTSLLLLVPLSAIGLNYSITKIKNLSYSKIILVILISLIFINTFYGYYPSEQELKPYHLIEDSDYKVLKWLENNYGSHNKVIVPKRLEEAIYPITKNYPHYSRFIAGNPVNFDFFNKTCEERNNMIHKQFKAKFVVSEEPIECKYLINIEEVYQKDNQYIYKTTY